MLRVLALVFLAGCGRSVAFDCGDSGTEEIRGPSTHDAVAVYSCTGGVCRVHDGWMLTEDGIEVWCQPGVEYVVTW